MPRTGRLHIPGSYYHVLGRGLERRNIFAHDKDKEDFLSRLGKCLANSQAQCLAWAIMSNHYHLLVRAGEKPLSKLMAPLLGGFAGQYNRRHKRSGYVFQNRFKSILCDADRYLLQLVRYIHLNPLRANLVDNLEDLANYAWTGHAGLLGRSPQSWHEVHEVLCLFGTTRREARHVYCKFMAASIDPRTEAALSGGGLVRSYGGWEVLSKLRKEHSCCIGDERILGDTAFVQKALAQDNISIDHESRLTHMGWTLEKLISVVCNLFTLNQECLVLRSRSNKYSIAKALICYWGMESLGLSTSEIGKRLQISQQGVSYWIRKGEKYSDENKLDFEEDVA